MVKKISEMNIAVLKGGLSSEREVSLRSGAAVAKALAAQVASVVEVDIQSRDFELPAGTDMAFIALHGAFGEDGQVQEILEQKGIAYTGAGVLESRNGFDKIPSKLLFEKAGVKTPAFEILKKPADTPGRLRVPFVVKPPCQGSSVGIEIVKDPDEIKPAIQRGYEYSGELLIEEFHPGRELTVGIIGDRVLPVVEIKPKSGFYDYKNKYTQGASDYQVPAILTVDQTRIVQQEALKAYQSLGADIVYGRVDVILDEDNNPWVLEVNTIPGMTATSLLPKAAAAVGISFPELCQQVMIESIKVRQPVKEVTQ